MTTGTGKQVSLSEVHGSIDTTRPARRSRRFLAFLGPAYLVSVGYMDPGNWATDLAGGSKFGYSLIWVLLMSNLMALLLQNLSARLGIVRGKDLAQVNREVYPPLLNFVLYVLAEIAIAACDLAEVLGMAIGIHLLTGIPILWGVIITVLDTFLLLYLQKLGMRKTEAFIITLVAIISTAFLVEILFAKPDLGRVVTGFVPHIQNEEALYIAIGMIGATVMPHNLYLHSALVQTRKFPRDEKGIRRAIRLNFLDSAIALNLAFFVNAAILVLAATVFFGSATHVASLQDAYKLLPEFLGSSTSAILFAVALIASGQSSTVTGTLAGQIVMEGYLLLRINPMLRRLITRLIAIIPTVIVILVYGDQEIDALLVFSQVILSIQLGFAVIPLIFFVSDRQTMGKFRAKPVVQVLAWIVASTLVYLNLKMVFGQAFGYLQEGHPPIVSMLVWTGLILLTGLLLLVIALPLLKRSRMAEKTVHHTLKTLGGLAAPRFSRIAVALDFGSSDEKMIAFAIGQAVKDSSFILIHIVESASSRMFGPSADDLESRRDEEQLRLYASQLQEQGWKATPRLGYQNRVSEIVRIVKEENADMLVVGAHGHTGIKDLVYGQTINRVRHELKIPVLVVNL